MFKSARALPSAELAEAQRDLPAHSASSADPYVLLSGPRDFDIGLAVYKDFPLTERARLQFRAEAFNFIDTSSFGPPNAQVCDQNFGTIGGASRPRNLQFGMKVIF